MAQYLVVGNWKMNGSEEFAGGLLDELSSADVDSSKVKLSVCPPSVYLGLAASKLMGSQIGLGAQNMCAESTEAGAYTGEVSAQMLKDVGCQSVIVGHSERRAYYGETNEVVAAKVKNALDKGLEPILCVGETLEQREKDLTLEIIADQLSAVFDVIGDKFSDLVVAYEPVWAIGTGLTATPEQAQEVHAFIRSWMLERISGAANDVAVLYGGSVKGENASGLFAQKDIDGALVGGASLKSGDFLAIANAV